MSDVYVVGIPDKKYGEQVLAAIILKAGQSSDAEEFTGFCQGRIARHKIPKYWEFVESVPMTASGKVAEVQDGPGVPREVRELTRPPDTVNPGVARSGKFVRGAQ
ncbi:MAG: hypothetical protein MZV49_09640 [Rhodopseudomonas palustris]|nr:hypothetical protein [Rhodopseudomonas palustris]